MKNISTVLFLIITIQCYSQNKMIINDGSEAAYPCYYGPSTKISSFSELPKVIQLNINGYLKIMLGSMSDSIQFTHGQEVDLTALFKKDSITFNFFWVRPKYDLSFKLSDNSIGIKRYNLRLELDEYGQLLDVNWPRRDYNDKSKFLPREKIRLFALEQAELRGFDTSSYRVYAQYNPTFDKLLWLFKFPNHPMLQTSNILEIDWNILEVFREYRVEDVYFRKTY